MVDRFEAALCEVTGAPYAVTTDSCTNALLLAFVWERRRLGAELVRIPEHTYVGVLRAAENAGWRYQLVPEKWTGSYLIRPTRIVDSAKHFAPGMYGAATLTCVSFQAGKLLPIGRGGAILHDSSEADEWLRRARLDGRTAGADYKDNAYQAEGWHCYMAPPDAARGLWLMTYLEDEDAGTWEEYPDLSKAEWR